MNVLTDSGDHPHTENCQMDVVDDLDQSGALPMQMERCIVLKLGFGRNGTTSPSGARPITSSMQAPNRRSQEENCQQLYEILEKALFAVADPMVTLTVQEVPPPLPRRFAGPLPLMEKSLA